MSLVRSSNWHQNIRILDKFMNRIALKLIRFIGVIQADAILVTLVEL